VIIKKKLSLFVGTPLVVSKCKIRKTYFIIIGGKRQAWGTPKAVPANTNAVVVRK
jgi:hypothetical protein